MKTTTTKGIEELGENEGFSFHGQTPPLHSGNSRAQGFVDEW